MAVVLAALLLNLPFLLCHPEMPVVTTPLLRSLAVNAMLFVLPGLPIVHLLVRTGRVAGAYALWLVLVSFSLFVGVIAMRAALGLPPDSAGIWLAMCLVTNAGALLDVWWCGPPKWDPTLPVRRILPVALVFLVAYALCFEGAARIVPRLGDQDDDMHLTAYGLMARLEPALLTNRDTEFFFAHPLMAHVVVGGSLVYYNRIRDVAAYDSQAPNRLTLEEVRGRYEAAPYLLETRTPNVFLSALTVALLAAWLARLSESSWYALLVAAVYTTSPEVFIRSSYAGYFAIGTLFSLSMLMVAPARGRGEGLVAGGLAALSDHKTVLVPLAVAAWELVRAPMAWGLGRIGRALRSPVVLGFAAGTAVFWVYGLVISPHDFWMDHVRHHLVDRALNHNARGLDLTRYPAVGQLWLELLRHTGYLLVPLAAAMLGLLCVERPPDRQRSPAGWRSQAGLWALTVLAIGGAFSVVDWRQTKHLAPLMLIVALSVGTAGRHRHLRLALGVALAVVLTWNVWMLVRLAGDFSILQATPEW